MESRFPARGTDTSQTSVDIPGTLHDTTGISLLDLWRVIVRRKAIVLGGFLLTMLLPVVYLLVAKPLYKANAYLLPPQPQAIQQLMVEDVGLSQYTPQLVFKAFLDNLKSRGLRREFFEKHDLADHYVSPPSAQVINADKLFDEYFVRRLNTKLDQQQASFVTVSFSDTDPVFAAQLLNQIIDFANKRTVQQLIDNVDAAIQSEISSIRHQLDSKLKLAEQRRRDTIIALKEALRVATALGIKDRASFPVTVGDARSEVAINTAELPLYMRGTKALETEISVLEARKSDEAFIKGFRDLQERRTYLDGISIDANALATVAVDTEAKVPYDADRPSPALIIILASVAALMAGIIMAVAFESVTSLRRHTGK